MRIICKPVSYNKKLAKAIGIKNLNPFAEFRWVSSHGFGSFTFYMCKGKIMCDNELMSKDFIKKALSVMVDKCVLTEK